eukprot:CAMPEP_0204877138 /NCGR_PEP_ID=MMETSP1348-20121228/48032_1 /ASSEMBLY_ACC=CAM_ASM_000700 /TAXON_ID=215587 /ORGANISM="Aplanochytrium stocchinoi, Strain GSBS06" /LENGTH=211 /DNA_ID=CAMNT_0052033985 /DNA_START=153 /DNA_END=788 /DNA_ORIENTATION=-
MKITCKYRSNVILDKYEERLMMCSRIKGHDAAVKEIFRMWNQANTTSIMEPKGLVENNHRPDLVLSSFQNNNQQILLDFTTITALSAKVINNAWKQSGYFQNNNQQILLDFTTITALSAKVINNAWKQSGYTANKAENSKNQSYANAYDANSYDLLPLVMDLEGCPGEGLAKFIKHVPKKLDNISIRQKMNPADTARNLLTNGNAKLFWHS